MDYEFHFHFVDYGSKAFVLDNHLHIMNQTTSNEANQVSQLNQVRKEFYYYDAKENCSYFDQSCSIVLDVGGALEAGVIDNHYVDGELKSAFRLMRERTGLWSHLFQVRKINVIVHDNPDFDCIASVYYLMSSLINHEGPDSMSLNKDYIRKLDLLEQYTTLNDNGCMLYDSHFDCVPHLLIRFLQKTCRKIAPDNRHAMMTCQVLRGCELLQAFMDHISIKLWALNRFHIKNTCSNPMQIFAPLDYDNYLLSIRDTFEQEIRELKKDYACYEQALARAKREKDYKEYIHLPVLSQANEPKSRLVKAIFFHEPLDCELHKDYARADGYVLTFIPTKSQEPLPEDIDLEADEYYVDRSNRVIISVTEDSDLDLRRIAIYLEQAEVKKERNLIARTKEGQDLYGKKLVTIRKGEKLPFQIRAGIKRFPESWCSNSDPWYDGRYNNYSIIDSPAVNSLLSIEEIYAATMKAILEELEQFSLCTILPFTISKSNHKANRNLFKAYKEWLTVVKEAGFRFKNISSNENHQLYDYINKFFFMESDKLKTERVSHFEVDIEPISLVWDKNKLNSLALVNAQEKIDESRNLLKLNIQCIAFRYSIGFYIIHYQPMGNLERESISAEELISLNHRLMSGEILTKQGPRTLANIIQARLCEKYPDKGTILQEIFRFGQPLTYNSIKFNEKCRKYSLYEIGYKLSNGYLLEDPYHANCYQDQLYEDTHFPIENIGDLYLSKNGCTFIANQYLGIPETDQAADDFYQRHQNTDLLIYLLVLQQRYALLNFSEKLADYTNRHSVLDKRAITKLRKSFLDFTTQGWFGQISGYEYIQTLFKKTKDVMEVDNLYSEVDQQIETIDEYNQAQFNQLVQNLSFFGILFVIINFFGGSNLFDMEGGWDISKIWNMNNREFILLVSFILWISILIFSLIKKSSKLK